MRFIESFKPGEEVTSFFLVGGKSIRDSRQGRPFLELTLKDSSGSIGAKYWDVPEDLALSVNPGDYVKVMGRVELFNEVLQLIIKRIRHVEDGDRTQGFDETLLFESTGRDIEAMWEELLSIAGGLAAPLGELVSGILTDYQERMRLWPGARQIHHPFLGGLLEHTLSVARSCEYFSEKYEVDRDLLVAGGILHDLGKLLELTIEGGLDYTVEGKLIGHMVLGRDLIRDKAREIAEFPRETLLRLEHMVLSHQGQLEWKSPVVPMSLEALILHYADDLDAKVNIFRRAIDQDRGEGPFTEWHRVLQREIFKGLPPEAEGEEE